MVQTGIWSGSTPHKFELFSRPRFPVLPPPPFFFRPTFTPSQFNFAVAFLRILQEVSYRRPQLRSRREGSPFRGKNISNDTSDISLGGFPGKRHNAHFRRMNVTLVNNERRDWNITEKKRRDKK